MLKRNKGFTLLELLIVITILAILTLVVVLFINPVEMLKKARDVQRMSDLAVTRTAITLYMQDQVTDLSGCGSETTPAQTATSTQWVSIANDVETFTTAYNATSSANLQKNDGNGCRHLPGP